MGPQYHFIPECARSAAISVGKALEPSIWPVLFFPVGLIVVLVVADVFLSGGFFLGLLDGL